MCSGKIYYDLIEAREKSNNDRVVFIRIEQLYPFPAKTLANLLKKYEKAEFIWCQEEPQNQGAWFSHRHRLQRVLDRLGKDKEITLVSRPPAAAPAVGMMKLHLEQQSNLVTEALQ